jgi:DNA-binding LacI/PurR family transcriptional regulator
MKPKRPKKRPTSQDVAKLAGVSVATVSYVINHKSGGNVRISDSTRQKVWKAVEALSYRPLDAARTLRTRRSYMLALMIPYIETPYLPLFAAAVQQEAEKEGFRVLLYDTRQTLEREQDFLNILPSYSLDGVIIHSEQLEGDSIAPLIDMGIAVVIHGNRPEHPYADNVLIDEVKASEEVVHYLIDKGHRRIALISHPESTWSGALRKQGYINALQAASLPVDGDLMCQVKHPSQGGSTACMQRLLTLSDPPTAVFCGSDRFAIEVLLFATDAGLLVPEDLAVIGFDGTPQTANVRPRLTAIRKDVDLMGALAAQMLIERINSEQPLPARKKVVDHELVCQESA